MKRLVWVAVLVAVLLCGCSGVIMNAEYSDLLDRTAAWSASMAALAELDPPGEKHGLTDAEMAEALKGNAQLWQRFRDARDGKEGGR